MYKFQILNYSIFVVDLEPPVVAGHSCHGTKIWRDPADHWRPWPQHWCQDPSALGLCQMRIGKVTFSLFCFIFLFYISRYAKL